MRVAGIIIKDEKILLMHRVKDGREYYVFPGGSLEDRETEEAALKREISEELCLKTTNHKRLFEIKNQGRREVYYLISEFDGVPQIGGPEKERMNAQNQYIIEWIELSKISDIGNLCPQEAVAKLIEFLRIQE